MTVRNLDSLLKPTSIALIGASRRPNSIGAVVAKNLFHAGFDGPIMPVNPREKAIEGVLAYKSIAELPISPDLAVICTPPDTIPGIIDELGSRGTRAAVVITAGFGEIGEQGKALQQKVLDAAKPHTLRILGPNCLGLMIPGRGVNASFVHVAPMKGDIALVAQSGAVLTSVVDWATNRKIGFSHLISLGNKTDVDFSDLLDYLAADPQVRAILLYIEALTHTRKFMSAARAAARQKPVIVIKAGRSEEAAKAASSHTGAMAGSDRVYDAAFRRAGVLRVHDLDELFDAVETVAMGVSITGGRRVGRRLAILTNGGGIGVLATDSLIEGGGQLAKIGPEAMKKLNSFLPATWSHGNPVDIIGDATARRYSDSLAALLEDSDADAFLVLNCPTAVGDSYWAAQAVIDTLSKHPNGKQRPVLTSWLGEGTAIQSRSLFAANSIPTYDTPGDATRAFMHLVQYSANQEQLMETPDSVLDDFTPDDAAVRRIIDVALAENRPWLSEYEAKQVLAAYGVPVVDTRRVTSPEEAEEAARAIGGRVALKILSPDITHKSDVGGVVLGIPDPEQTRMAAQAMLERVKVACPDARIEGFTVQQMAVRTGAHELIIGMTDDHLFGPVILFGHGGVSVEVVADQALALPPLNLNLARELISRTRVYRLLRGYRDRPAAAMKDIALTLMKVSQLVIDFADITELDINPLFADEQGVLALDARIKVARPSEAGSARLAIPPYPKSLEEMSALKDGSQYLLRPIRPEDEPAIHRLFEHMTPEDIRLRFFAPMRRLSHQAAARLTQIDYDREMGLVAVAKPFHGPVSDIQGAVRIAADPDNQKAEFAVMVQSDLKGHGLGTILMKKIIEYAKGRGIGEIYGEVLRENHNMLNLCRDLGFSRKDDTEDMSIVEVRLTLEP
ncbi:MAG: bifunctional acetate--CoA ligase family protein/GNAT family N-acetyltransferase [Rhodospirillaceae bacterium]